MSNRMIHTLYTKAVREAATEEGKKKMEAQAVEDVMTQGGLI